MNFQGVLMNYPLAKVYLITSGMSTCLHHLSAWCRNLALGNISGQIDSNIFGISQLQSLWVRIILCSLTAYRSTFPSTLEYLLNRSIPMIGAKFLKSKGRLGRCRNLSQNAVSGALEFPSTSTPSLQWIDVTNNLISGFYGQPQSNGHPITGVQIMCVLTSFRPTPTLP